MYKYSQVRTVHLEITSKCNASCPMCLRTVCGGGANPNLPLRELDLDTVKKIFDGDFVSQLNRMYMCGNYGDPIVAKDTLDVFKYFRENNPSIRLDMFTNGSARDQSWWTELAGLINSVHFSVDGLKDTNSIYRRGTHFDVIMKNMAIFIGAGGKVIWDFIVFRHNEHQVEEARSLAAEMGVHSFNLKKTGRFFSNVKMARKDEQVVYKKDGEVDYYIEMPQDPKYRNSALGKEQSLIERYGSLENYLDQTPVSCKVAKEKSLYISAMGRAFPCCWTANQLYPWYFKEKSSYMWKLLGELPGGVDNLDLSKKSLQEVVDGPFFQELLIDSWQRESLEKGKPKCCAKTCGTEFDPFKAQFDQGTHPVS